MKKKLIIVSASIERSPLAFPMGALSIYTSVLHDEELNSSVEADHRHFYSDSDDPYQSGKEIASLKPAYLGISLYLFNREWMYAFLSAFTASYGETVIWAGGPDVISDPEALIARGISYLTIGEGESSVRRLLSALLEGQEPEGRGIYSPRKPSLLPSYEENLDALPSPILTLQKELGSYHGILWEMTRGCPFSCSFCAESRGNRKVRSYALDRLEKELQVIKEEGIEHVFVLDPTFNLEKKRTMELLTFLVENSPEEIHYTFEVRGELLDEPSIQLFSALTCSLQIGLQSSNTQVMKHVDRSFDPDRFYTGVSALHSHGIIFGLDLIIALPHDTLESFEQSVSYAVKLRPSNLDIFTLSLLPGTEIYETRDTFALSYQKDSPYEVEETTTMSRDDIRTAGKIRRGCDIFYTKGEAVMWFLRVIEVLELSAARFFLAFCEYLEDEKISDEYDTFVLQEEFIQKIYREKGKESYLPLILSYVELHQGLCYLRDSGEEPVVTLAYPLEVLTRLDTEEASSVLSDPLVSEYPHQLLLYQWEGEIMTEEI